MFSFFSKKDLPHTSSEDRWAKFALIERVVKKHINRLEETPQESGIGNGFGKAADMSRALSRLKTALLYKDRQDGINDDHFCRFDKNVDPKEISFTDFSTIDSMLDAKFSQYHCATEAWHDSAGDYPATRAGYAEKRASLREATNISRQDWIYRFNDYEKHYDYGDIRTTFSNFVFGRTPTLTAVEEELTILSLPQNH